MARNTFFQFKKFIIQQDHCAMKVCTDACIFGAFIQLGEAKKVLDIGSGTGLLPLMLAQRFDQVHFTGVEIDKDAFTQSVQNSNDSIYSERINIVNGSIQIYKPIEQFDVIVTNPPFYQEDLKSPTYKRSQAHHAVTLNFEDVLQSIDRLLTKNGYFYILLPEQESLVFKSIGKNNGWFLSQELLIRNDEFKKPFRRIMVFSRLENERTLLNPNVLDIYYPESRNYTENFRLLLNPYYLQF